MISAVRVWRTADGMAESIRRSPPFHYSEWRMAEIPLFPRWERGTNGGISFSPPQFTVVGNVKPMAEIEIGDA